MKDDDPPSVVKPDVDAKPACVYAVVMSKHAAEVQPDGVTSVYPAKLAPVMLVRSCPSAEDAPFRQSEHDPERIQLPLGQLGGLMADMATAPTQLSSLSLQ